MKNPNKFALNMIIGPHDVADLAECLESIHAGDFFDEIVLCRTFSSGERGCHIPSIDLLDIIAEEYKAEIITRPWISERYPFGDFAGARNACIDATESGYIMWLDCDDRVKFDDRWFKIKSQVTCNPDVDAYMMDYFIDKLEDGTFSRKFRKDRIFKNTPEIRWKYPVHEQLDLHTCKQIITLKGRNICIEHHSVKSSPVDSIQRNIKILEHEMKVNPNSHAEVFYANEIVSLYSNTGDDFDRIKAVRLLMKVIDKRIGANSDNLAMMCFTVCMYLLYHKETSGISTLLTKDMYQAELYARLALSFSDTYAESHVFLGDIYLAKGDEQRAVFHYKEAMQRTLDGMSFQTPAYYEEYPAKRLMSIFAKKREVELALFYSRLVLKHSPNDNEVHDFRMEVLTWLVEEEKKWQMTMFS